MTDTIPVYFETEMERAAYLYGSMMNSAVLGSTPEAAVSAGHVMARYGIWSVEDANLLDRYVRRMRDVQKLQAEYAAKQETV